MINLEQVMKSGPHATGKILREVMTAEEKVAARINMLETDIEKILAFEAAKGNQNAFMIINKAQSHADVYKAGKQIDRFEVAVGETVGDSLNTATYYDGKFGETGRTTPPGQYFTVAPFGLNIKNREDFESGKIVNCLVLNGVQHPIDFRCLTSIGLHQVPKSHPERLEMLDIKDTRRSMTTGCVNFMPEDFYRLADEINPNRTSVYILPEDTGNKLEVVLLPKGLWMKPKYADLEKENIFVAAMKKFFKIN